MDLDPHTIHTIIQKIEQQLRCPQCGRKVPINWGAIRLTGGDFVLLQLRCDACEAYIVLHAAVQSLQQVEGKEEERARLLNASTLLCGSEAEVQKIREALEQSGGSFGPLLGSTDSTGLPQAGSPQAGIF